MFDDHYHTDPDYTEPCDLARWMHETEELDAAEYEAWLDSLGTSDEPQRDSGESVNRAA